MSPLLPATDDGLHKRILILDDDVILCPKDTLFKGLSTCKQCEHHKGIFDKPDGRILKCSYKV